MQNNIDRIYSVDPEIRLKEALGEPYIKYRNLWNQVEGGFLPSFPIHLDFELQDLCNQSCIMCPRNEKLHDKINYKINSGKYLEYSIFQKIIDEGVGKGLKSINIGAFSEPLIHPEIIKIVDYAKKAGIVDIRIITNGLLLGKHADELISAGLTNLFVSVDASTSETYEKIRGHGFSKVVDSIEKSIAIRDANLSGLPIIRVSFVEMDINRHEKNQFIEHWKDRVDFVDIQISDNYNISGSEVISALHPKKWDCLSPWSRLAILADGTVLPCCNFNGRNLPIGNAIESSIEEIWNSYALENVRKNLKSDKSNVCKLCQRV
jgi:radical SAM protein with 4Fe4S-binding SPASM domain